MKVIEERIGAGKLKRMSMSLKRLALRWTDAWTPPDVDFPEFAPGSKTEGYSWFQYNVYKCVSYTTKHIYELENGKLRKRASAKKLYSDKLAALKSLRSELENKFATILYRLDVAIEKEMTERMEVAIKHEFNEEEEKPFEK